MTRYATLCLIAFVVAPTQGDDGNADDARLVTMRRRVTELRATIPGGVERASLPVLTEPLLRFNDPARDTTDGSIWAVGETGRPRALLSLFLEPRDDGPGVWSYEFVDLGTDGLAIKSTDDWSWTPKSTVFETTPLPDAGRPAAAKGPRMTQMKLLARRFAATERFLGEEYRLKMKPQPIHRYSDPADGLLDGAMFVFSYGTNPEVLLVLECRGEAGSEAWEYGFARLTAAQCGARLGKNAVWSRENVDRSLPTDPYFIQYVPDDEGQR